MIALKALSKMGHNCTPKGLSILGSGSAFKRSAVLDDIVGIGYGDRMSAAMGDVATVGRDAVLSEWREKKREALQKKRRQHVATPNKVGRKQKNQLKRKQAEN